MLSMGEGAGGGGCAAGGEVTRTAGALTGHGGHVGTQSRPVMRSDTF